MTGQMVGAIVGDTAANAGIGVVGLFFFAIWVWALVNVLRRPAYAFERAGVNRSLWLILLIVTLFCGLAGIVGMVYLIFADTKVSRQQQLGRGPGFPGYP
jgi:hypothetical protein